MDPLNGNITKNAYQEIRNTQKINRTPLLPSYHKVLEAKLKCYPTHISIDETSAEVKLQTLLDHTCSRILQIQDEVINAIDEETLGNLRFIFKWRCDGSSGHSQYKQNFIDLECSDASIFMTSLVLLQLLSSNILNGHEIVVWKNQRPPSPQYCRPIKIQFSHENTNLTCAEKEIMDSRIASLVPLETIVNGKAIKIKYEMIFSMVDGKVINAVTGTTSTLRCHLCKATSKGFNKIDQALSKEIEVPNSAY